MEQGNPNKINAIVEEIVKGNEIFKLKSPIEQDKEKDSIAKGINTALSILNEEGRKLVLQDLSVDPDEKFKGVIDSVGNIDISGITKLTAAIVTAKIEEAEREGINLRKDAPNTVKDIKNEIVEGGLTLIAIDTMVKNFKDLSYTDKKQLFDNWKSLTTTQKKEVLNAESQILRERASNEKNPGKKEIFEKAGIVLNNFSEKFDEISRLTDKEISYNINIFLHQNKEFLTVFEEMRDKGKSDRDIYTYFLEQKSQIIYGQALEVENVNKIEDLDGPLAFFFKEVQNIEEAEVLKNNDMRRYWGINDKELINYSQEEILSMHDTYLFRTTPEILQYYNITSEEAQQMSVEECCEMFNRYNISQNRKKDQTLEEKILQEVQQFSIELVNYSHAEIKDALKMYTEMIKMIPITEYSGMTKSVEIIEYFKAGLETAQTKADEILGILAQNDFGGNLYQILTNPEILNGTFLPILENEIERLEQSIAENKDKKEGSSQITDPEYSRAHEKKAVDMVVDEVGLEKAKAELAAKKVAGIEDTEVDTTGAEGSEESSSDSTGSQVKNDEEVSQAPKVEILYSQNEVTKETNPAEREEHEEERFTEDHDVRSDETADNIFQGMGTIDLNSLFAAFSNMPNLTEAAVNRAGKETKEVITQVRVVDGKVVETEKDNSKTQETKEDEKDEV